MTTEQWDPSVDLPDLRGKVAVVTGAGTGIGFATVKLLAQKGAKVYLTTRNESKALNAKDTLIKDPAIKPDNVQWLILDLFDPVSITTAAEELKRRETKIDILIGRRQIRTAHDCQNASKDEKADVRIINVTTCFRDPVPLYPWQWRFLGRFMFGFDMIRYGVSKAAVVLFTQELQRRFDEQGLPITCIAVHPGEVLTEGVLAINNFFVRAIARMSFISAEQGAANPLFAAAATEVRESVEKYKGKFLVPIGKLEAPNPVAEDGGQVKGLWENTVFEINQWAAEKKLPPLLAM
ncbi:hypothetical protein LCI18_011504 [Fusarium solani-melongenae]|uniref:Uncharacterized protein n=1 Tax=Fusarium solani subsp. cucurbitae TaxID=2747967 RepID=A0ACD3ZGX1_FUSSC|nr:hypothetical protein LCI18_011504 [Fusarium solani-melongenae]